MKHKNRKMKWAAVLLSGLLCVAPVQAAEVQENYSETAMVVREVKKDIVKMDDGKWHYTEDEQPVPSHTGVEKNSLGWWYVKEGVVDFSYTGFAKNEYGWWYCEDGKVTFQKDDIIQGIIDEKSGWWLVRGSKVTAQETVAQNRNGWWKTDASGKVDFSYNGFAKNEYGWWYCEDGKVTFQKNDILQGIVDGKSGWWLICGSKQTARETVAKNANGWWKTDAKGKVDFTANTVAKNEYGWWKIEDGKVNFDFCGIAKNGYGLWYLENGKVDFSYSGTTIFDSKVYSVTEGKAAYVRNVTENDFMWPLPGRTYISSYYGNRICPFHGSEFHGGIDIPAWKGTAIFACADGTVKKAGYSSSMGKYIEITHADGISTSYWHCDTIKVSKGQKVSMGEMIGTVGQTGNATGSHLDLRFYVSGSTVDPLSFVTPK